MNAKSIVIAVAAMALSNECLRAGSDSAVAEVRALAETVDKKQRVECVRNLKQVAMGIQIWITQSADTLPPDLLTLSNELGSPRLLVCPADATRQVASDWASATTTNRSYKLLAPSARVAAPQEVVLLCPVHGNVSLMDGSVQSRVARTCPERFILKGDGTSSTSGIRRRGPGGLLSSRQAPEMSGGGSYVVGKVRESPRCSVAGHELPTGQK